MRQHVVVISTGGTIAMLHDSTQHGDVPALGSRDIVAAIPASYATDSVEAKDFSNIPSFHMTPERMLSLAKEVETVLAREDVGGVVITHGTDTLEETAFFLDLFLPAGKPVCVTGAMRTNSHAAPDGPYNLMCALKAAACGALTGYGVLVVMNGQIHAARCVTKMHSSSVGTFVSPDWGPLGYVEDDVILLRPPLATPSPLRPERLSACVPILKAYTGMDGVLLDAAANMRPDGLVLEGFGRGNFPASVVPTVRRLLDRGIAVVAASRVPSGRTLGVYATEGGGAHLHALGVILSGMLSSQKARIKLLLALSSGVRAERIAALFAEHTKKVEEVDFVT